MRGRVFCLAVVLFPFTSLGWSASVSQQTRGACSPNINRVGRDVTIVINCRGVDQDSINQLMKLGNDLPRLEENLNQFMQEVREALARGALDTKQVQEIIALRHRAIFASSEQDAKRWAKELFDSLPTKEQETKSLAASGKEFAEKLLLKWNPVYDFVLKTFDDRIFAVGKYLERDLSKRYELILVFDKYANTSAEIRHASFLRESHIRITLDQGQMHRGVITRHPRLMVEQNVNGARDWPVIVSFELDRISVRRHRGFDHKTMKTYTQKGDDPLMDEEFRREIAAGIGDAISFTLTNDMAGR